MDYRELAKEFLEKMLLMKKVRAPKKITDNMQGEMFILHFISLHDEAVLPGEISNEMSISSARIAAVLNNLENKGLISRRIDTSDRRRILIELTQTGRELAEKHHNEVIDDAAMLLSYLGEHDAREAIRIIGKLAEMPHRCREPE